MRVLSCECPTEHNNRTCCDCSSKVTVLVVSRSGFRAILVYCYEFSEILVASNPLQRVVPEEPALPSQFRQSWEAPIPPSGAEPSDAGCQDGARAPLQ
jgi:hypothetical protein